MGDWEARTSVLVESALGYHSYATEILTRRHKLGLEQCQVGSLTGAVASQRVTEAPKGSLRTDGNRSKSVMVEGSLTVRPTSRAGTKVGHSDQAVENGIAVA